MSSENDALNITSVGKEASDLLAAIHRECFPHYWNEEAFTDFFSVEGTVAFIAAMQQQVGMVIHRVQHEQADIITIAVRPEFRKRGIAAALVKASLEKACAQGAEKMFLDVEEGNAPAIALYEKFGFSHLRRRKLYYRQKDGSCTDALVMVKKLK